jgi:hypothetical protein
VELRTVLTRYNIEWKDRGNNCSAGWVNINCPFCRDDPSQHLRISDQLAGYYCLRNRLHKGGIHYLFSKLGIPTDHLPTPGHRAINIEPPKEKVIDSAPSWMFAPAEDNQEMLDYLEFRKFLLPEEVCKKFRLQFSPFGKWAGRLIIPLTVGWTGRSVRPHIEPRYLAETTDAGFFTHGKGETAIIVEGQLDGMKIAAASSQFLVCATGGGEVSYALINFLRDKGVRTIHSVPDNDAAVSQRMALLSELRTGCPFATVHKTHLPPEFKDAGEMTEVEAKQWLYSLTY